MAGQAPANATDELLTQAKESLELGDVGGAAQAYAEVLQAEPDNVKALGGLARCYLTGGDAERAREVADMAPPGAKDADLDSVRAALALADEAPAETSEFERRLAKNAEDHEARFEIAKALAARGAWDEAADHLLKIIERDRTWNDEAARKQLITIFEAAGAASDVTRTGRRRLSSILFS
jgi:putative thioredoxin